MTTRCACCGGSQCEPGAGCHCLAPYGAGRMVVLGLLVTAIVLSHTDTAIGAAIRRFVEWAL